MVDVVLSPEGDIFPVSWGDRDLNPKFVPLSRNKYERTERLLKQAMSKYPSQVIRDNLNTIYVFDELTLSNQKIGGTIAPSTVYLVNNGTSDFEFEKSFHHEFAHLLFFNYQSLFDANKWIENNSDDFLYGKSGFDVMLAGKSSKKYDYDLYKKGFLYEYAMADIYEDFASIAENIFVESPLFLFVAGEFKPINNKFRMIVAFYRNIDSSFKWEYYRQLL
jgi:hypothetical protein